VAGQLGGCFTTCGSYLELQTGVTSTGKSCWRHRHIVIEKIPLKAELHGAGFMERNPS
jgi:hypothetical protein